MSKVYLLMVLEYELSHVHRIYESRDDAKAEMRLLEALNEDFDKLSAEALAEAERPAFYDCAFLVREMPVVAKQVSP